MTKLPEHLFLSDLGDLHDTRQPEWYAHPLRQFYRRTFREISSVAQIKATLRAGRYTSLGSYPLYFVTSDGAALSFETVRENLRDVMGSVKHGRSDGWRVCGVDINWEDADLLDDHTGEPIESAYGGGA